MGTKLVSADPVFSVLQQERRRSLSPLRRFVAVVSGGAIVSP